MVALVNVAAEARSTTSPLLLPDEYLYAELSRSIAETGRPLVRGVSGQFPALLEPIVLAPTWLVGDVAVSYRLGQAIPALALSLAAGAALFFRAHPGGRG